MASPSRKAAYRVVRLDDLTEPQRRLVLALLALAEARAARKVDAA